ncbi:hypothetical protein [Opitutus sp. ER46]|uniref:hypothetical protein n=1 Tax=Opitutus sp. ER46 TaxID=2161864 RepID=UPI000D2FC767|nr:hypothetical protein [Opitutus sp. ER46]PTX92611.1 hypothetical protein DB354_14900 [Opitutus sp. ER46]
MIVLFDNAELLPAAWRDEARGQAVRVFNAGLLRERAGWLLAYRVVIEPAAKRRIAICRLTERFAVVPGSPVALSDQVRFGALADAVGQTTTWFADPRLYRLSGRLFVYWNSGWHEPQNHQFLQELDAVTLQPVSRARELALAGRRQKLEKNWALFEADGLFAVYSVHPHRVLRFSLAGNGPIEFSEVGPATPNPGGYAQAHGGLRGGAPPQRCGDHFYSFCHSIENGDDGYHYTAGVYRFAARAPFAPTDMPRIPVAIPLPAAARRSLPKLNAAIGGVVYPAGAAYANGHWVVSLGVDDERCALAILDHQAILATLEPVATNAGVAL